MRTGLIGLGNMGASIAGLLLDAGISLVVHDVRREPAIPLQERGAVWAESPADLAEVCEVVLTCLPGPPEVDAVVMGHGGVLEKLQPNAVYIDLTTNSPELVRKVGEAVKKRRAYMLDAPLDGGKEGAEAGDLTLFVGGDEAVLERARLVLEPFSKSVVWVGELGAGSVTKIVHNALAMSIDLLLTECLTLGVKAGVELPRLIRAIRQGSSMSGNMSLNKRLPATLFRGEFSPRFALKLAHKDYELAAELAERYQVPTRLIDICLGEVSEAINRGWGDKDRTIASTLQEERAKVKLRV